MINYWVFTAVDHKGKDAPNAAEVFKSRVKNKFWALNSRAKYAKQVQAGDKVVLCLGGTYCRGFAGSALLASNLQELSHAQRKHIRGLPSEKFDHYVKFRSATTFRQVRCLGDYLNKVSFLKGDKPRLPQGSIIKIDKEQYDTLTQ